MRLRRVQWPRGRLDRVLLLGHGYRLSRVHWRLRGRWSSWRRKMVRHGLPHRGWICLAWWDRQARGSGIRRRGSQWCVVARKRTRVGARVLVLVWVLAWV